eukprot:122978_1
MHCHLNRIIACIHCIYVVNAIWKQSDTTMPRTVDDIAVGFDGNEFYIFGGKLLMRYNVTDDTFTDDGNILSADIKVNAQSYHQYSNMLYIITNTTFSVYNFNNKQFIDHWMTIDFPIQLDQNSNNMEISCLVATDESIFVVGGRVASESQTVVQRLNLLTYNWTFSYMNQGRDSLSCAVDYVTNKLYAIAGKSESNNDFFDSIEMINIDTIDQQSWVILDDKLTTTCAGSRALSHSESNRIFVIGGYGPEGKHYNDLDTVHIINTITDAVSLSTERLPYQVVTTGAIIVENTMYCFGGYDGTAALDTWFYYTIESNELPTSSPVYIPSNDPTISGTLYVTLSSSNAPINAPTFAPSTPNDLVITSSAPSNAYPYVLSTLYTHDNAPTAGTNGIAVDDEIIIITVVTLLFLLLCCYIVSFLYHRKVQNQPKFKVGVPAVVAKKIIFKSSADSISLQEINMNVLKTKSSPVTTAIGNDVRSIGEKDHEENGEANVVVIGEKGSNAIRDASVYRANNINIGNDDEVIMGDDEITSGTKACVDYGVVKEGNVYEQTQTKSGK